MNLSDGVGDFEFRWGVKIPLRDGIQLNATLYIPSAGPAPAPCLCLMTPYISDTHHERGVYFASRGLAVAIVDVRGRGNSQGQFVPLLQEARDGYDIVEWLARQSFCNGKVGMCGGSYLGYCQWATAKESPPHLVTIVPAASPCIGVDFPMRNNIFTPYLVQWLTLTSGHAAQKVIFSDSAFWAQLYRRWYESGLSFRQLDQFLGNPLPIFQEWLDHPVPDSYWDECNPTPDQYARMSLPILTITGLYDDNQAGALEHFRRHGANAPADDHMHHYLVIGPWDHAGAGWTPRETFGGVTFGKDSVPDLPKLHRDWFAWTLQGGPKPAFLKKRIAYYVTGLEQWKYSDSLDEITTGYLTFHLDSDGKANEVFESGHLTHSHGTGVPDSYTFDPRDTSGAEVAAEAQLEIGSIVDQSTMMALGGRQLVYHTPPFEEDTEVSGFIKLSAWIALDGPDTDLYVTVYEVTTTGNSIRLSTDGMRARYREDARRAVLFNGASPLRFEFDRFTFISRLIRKGHRLRLVIAPVGRLIDTIFSEKNYQGGGTVCDESVEQARSITVTLFHDPSHPSALQVPLGKSE